VAGVSYALYRMSSLQFPFNLLLCTVWISAGNFRAGDYTEVDGAFLGVLGKQLESD